MAGPRTWVDVDDLLLHADTGGRMGGVQRVVLELAHAMRQADPATGLLRHTSFGAWFAAADAGMLERAGRDVAGPAGGPAATDAAAHQPLPGHRLRRALFGALPPRTSAALGDCLRAIRLLGRGLVDLALALLWLPPYGTRFVRRLHRPFIELLAPWRGRAGDTVLMAGCGWQDTRAPSRIARLRRRGLHYALLVHDIIPLRHPEWSPPEHAAAFGAWLRAVLPQADTVLAISEATAADLRTFAAAERIALRGPVAVVPMASGMRPPGGALPRSPRLPPPGSYALLVSTLDPRKNHALAVEVWQRLLAERGPEAVPRLVFAGRAQHQALPLLARIAATPALARHIQHIDDATDAEVAALYQGCRFTFFPSLAEGWGLPVTESLAFGKPCLAARASSLPEAGGPLVRYFEPDAEDAARAVRALLDDPAGLAAWAARIEAEFTPRGWADMARAVLAALRPAA